ncbi:hypothetical protein O181_029047 [Austropuccinia psidii MF-1]|uniref:Retrotransposon gag domain-containing protein n=1 Tax=Austropuccinia psidii MF-1 TaxID=1389203 RepID=A0A9Q3CVS9_9BASI|nr:hypothetical protein [Austropuccinia psidii MF-1]
MEGAAPSRRGGMKSRRSRYFSGLLGGYPGMSERARARLGEAEDKEGEEFVKEGESEKTKVETALEGVPEAYEAANLAHSNQPLVSQAEPNFLNMMKQMTQFMGQLTQAVSPRHNSKEESSVLNSNEEPSYLLNNWKLFETQLFTLFGDPNEVRKAEQELDNLRMKESGHVSLYIADFRSLMSRIRDWGENAYIHAYRRGLAPRILNQLASYPGNFDTPQELMDITLESDSRYHERQKEKGSHQEKKPPVTGSSPSSLKTHLQKGLTIGRIRRASNFKLQRTSPILLSSIRTIN